MRRPFGWFRALVVLFCFWLVVAGGVFQTSAQSLVPAPDRGPDEGKGPFKTLAIRGATIIDGTGAPPIGPTNIIIKQNRIAQVGGSIPDDVDYEVDARGMYVLPGFIDMHAHLGSPTKAPEAEYVYKLWMAHGVTTVRGVPLAQNDFVLKEQRRSAANEIVAPRIVNYQRPPRKIRSPQEAREWVQEAPLKGIDGLKLGSYRPEIMEALLSESKRQGLGSTAHLGQMGVAQMNALDAARLGLDTVTHYYGHFEALLKDHVVQPWPPSHNYNDEQNRFAQVARLWDKIHPPGSEEWDQYLKEHLKLGTVFDPTLTIYSAGRDLMRARTAEWHEKYTHPSLWLYFQPSRKAHGSYWFYWTTHDEIAWKNFYQVWFQLINDYKNMGGRVTTGADSGFIYDTYGFAYIEELELLQEAGFHPLEVIQSATYNGALTLHEPKQEPIEFGVIREGLLADLVIVPENPLANFKVLLGTGAVKLNEETDQPERVGRVRWTIKDGVVYDAHQLLEDVAQLVAEQKGRATQRTRPATPAPTASAQSTASVRVSSAAPSTSADNRASSGRGVAPKKQSGADGQRKEAHKDEKKKKGAQTSWIVQVDGAARPEGPSRSDDSESPATEPPTKLATKSSDRWATENIILVFGADHRSLAAFSTYTGKWTKQKIELEGATSIEPVMEANFCYISTSTTIYAYCAEAGRWSSFRPPNGVDSERVVIKKRYISYRGETFTAALSGKTGVWAIHMHD